MSNWEFDSPLIHFGLDRSIRVLNSPGILVSLVLKNPWGFDSVSCAVYPKGITTQGHKPTSIRYLTVLASIKEGGETSPGIWQNCYPPINPNVGNVVPN